MIVPLKSIALKHGADEMSSASFSLDGYELDDDSARIDFAVVHAWLAETYWSPGISREKVERGAANSALVVGAYYKDPNSEAAPVQVGFMRVISDTTRFAYVCDVFVDPAHRGRRIAKAMVKFAVDHPSLHEISRWLLATRDAHEVYQAVGFGPLPEPARWMQYLPERQSEGPGC